MKRYSISAAAGFAAFALFAFAQGSNTYKARLSSTPVDAKSRPNLVGSGTVTAVLTGSKLSVNGSFEGLKGKATTASLHDGAATGVRGPAVHDLTVTSETSGTIAGSMDLTPQQVEHFKKGRFYVQLHGESAPDGVLWGWFLKE
jgi:CHRD domain